MPPVMQAHAKPILNQCMRGPRTVSGNRGGNRSAGGRGGDGKIRVFECLRRSINERISHFSPRLLFLPAQHAPYPTAEDRYNAAWVCALRSQMGYKYFI